MARARLGPRRHFGKYQAALEQRLLPRLILGRVENVDAAGDHADGATVQRAVMRRRIDPARQSGDDHRALAAEVMGQTPREAAGSGRCVARPDDCNRHAVEQIEPALGDQQRRRIVQLGQQPRVEPLAKRHVTRAKCFDPSNLGVGRAPAEQCR